MELIAESLSLKQKKNVQKEPDFLLHPFSLTASSGEVIGLIGPNGAGKSSMLKSLAGILRPETGRVILGGRELKTMSPVQRGRSLAYLPQNGPIPYGFTVEDLVSLGRLVYHTVFDKPEEQARIRQVLERCALSSLAQRRVETLSGGERARALLARALITEAPFLLVDEPVAALDPAHSLSVMTMLRHYAQKEAKEKRKTVIVVLHDLALAARFCTRLVLVHQGRILADASPKEVLTPALMTQAFGVTMRFLEEESEGEIVRLPLPWAHSA